MNFQIFNQNESQIILIGFCLQSDPCKKQNLNDIFNQPIEDIEIVLSTLVGNFIVIYNGMIYKDIGNLYKIFYCNHKEKIHWKNRLFLENRVGSWLSSIQHSYDMCSKIQRFSFPLSENIVASSYFLGPERNKISINEDLINLLIPELNNIRYK